MHEDKFNSSHGNIQAQHHLSYYTNP